MQVFPTRNQFTNHPASSALLTALEDIAVDFDLSGALLYRQFPLYKDSDGGVTAGS